MTQQLHAWVFPNKNAEMHTCTHQESCTKCTKIFKALLLTVPNTQHDRMDKFWCIYTMGYYTQWRRTTATHNNIDKSHKQNASFSVHKSVLYICVSISALQTGSSVPFFQVPHICVSIRYLFFSFWLTWLFFKPAFKPGSITGNKSVINYYNLKGSYSWLPAIWLGRMKTFTT